MPEYYVTWDINLDADDPVAAAQMALDILLESPKGDGPHTFLVTTTEYETDVEVLVDLDTVGVYAQQFHKIEGYEDLVL